VHRLGTPFFGRRYFRLLAGEFGSASRLLLVEREGSAIAGVLSFSFRDQILPYYAGSCAGARAEGAHDFMYWSLMLAACGEGLRWFDFGRSKRGTGAFDFKRHWGFAPAPLAYAYRPVMKREVNTANPLDPRYAWLARAWSRLPLAVANHLGPRLARHLG
jgi:FemAB-related protein (PEP-CTERM system-associated)